MKLTGVTCVKNEADIIEAFVRHNLHFLDNLIVLDHGSSDETPAILLALLQEGLALEILHDDTLGKLQGEKMTALMRRAAAQGSDWIFFLDADEFIKSPGNLQFSLPGKTCGVLKVAVETYCAHPTDSGMEINPVLRMKHRLASEPFQNSSLEERRHYLHCIVHRDIANIPECEVLQGNHQIMRRGVELEHQYYKDLSIAHFSLRSPGQYASKIAIGTLQNLARNTLAVPADSFYTSHLETLRRDFDLFGKNFDHFLPAYIEIQGHFSEKVEDPLIYRGTSLQYTPRRSDFATLSSNLLSYSESLARNLGRLPDLTPNGEKQAVRLTFKNRKKSSLIYCSSHSFPGPHTSEVIKFPLKDWNGYDTLLLEIQSVTAYIEFVSLALLSEDGTRREIPGPEFRACFKVFKRAQAIFHSTCFSCVKSISPAELLVNFRKFSRSASFNEVEIGLRFNTNPTVVGLRFFQEDPFVREEEMGEVFLQLSRKHRDLTRVSGFLRHHFLSFLNRFKAGKKK